VSDRQLYIEIVVDDKGAVQKLAQVDAGLKSVGTSAPKTAQGLTDFEKKMVTASAAGAFLADTVYDLARGALSNMAAGITKAVSTASAFQNTFIGLSTVAKAFRQDVGATTAAAEMLASDGLMTVQEAAAGLKNLLGAGFGLPEAIQLMTGFKDIAAFNRQASLEFGYAVVSATEGIKNQNSILVDNAGLTKNLSVILKEQGLAMSDLSKLSTDAGVKQKFLSGLMKEMAFATGDASKMADTYSGSLARKNTNAQLLRKEVGEKLMPAFELWNNAVNVGIGIVRSAPTVFMALAAAVGALATAVSGYGLWAIYGDTVTKVMIAGKAIIPTFAGMQAAAVAQAGSITALSATFLGLGAAIALAAVAAVKWYESSKTAELRAQELGAQQDVVNRAISLGADATIKYADAIEFLKTKELQRQVAMKAGTATQRELADAMLRQNKITRAEYDDTIILIEAEERRKKGLENQKSAQQAMTDAANRYRDEIRATGMSVEQLSAFIKKDEKAFDDWAEAVGLSKSTIEKLKDRVDTQAKATAEYSKGLQENVEILADWAAQLREAKVAGAEWQAQVLSMNDAVNAASMARIGGQNDARLRDMFDAGLRRDQNAEGLRLMGIDAQAMAMEQRAGSLKSLLGSGLKGAMASMPATILGAAMGGGNVGGAVGASIGGSIASSLTESITKKITGGTIGKVLGKTLTSAIPVVGPILGELGGKLVGKLFGGLFGGGEKKKVQEALAKTMEGFGGEDKFRAMAKEAGIADRELQKLFSTKKVKDYEAQLKKITTEMDAHNQRVRDAQALTDAHAQRQELLNAAVQRYGFQINEIGPLLKKQEMAKHAEQLLDDWKLLTEAGVEIENVVDRMGASASEFINRAVEFGIEVPSAMKPMLEAMIKEGQLLDKNGEAYKTLEETGVTFGETLTEMFKGVLQKLDELIAKLTEASKPRTATVDVYERYHRSEEREDERRHWGGMIERRAHTGLAIDEVPIIAQRGEGILSRRGMRNVGGRAGLHSLNHGGGAAVGNDQVVAAINRLASVLEERPNVVQIDGDLMAAAVPRAVKRRVGHRGF
jgi:hypothetical protein